MLRAKHPRSLIGVVSLVLLGLALTPARATGPREPGRDAAVQVQPPTSTSYRSIREALARGEISRAEATVLLARLVYAPGSLPARFEGPIGGREGTAAREDLQEGLASLGPARTAVVERLIGTDVVDDHSCSGSTGTLPNVKRTRHFVLFYDAIGGGLTIDDYASVLERVWGTEIKAFGWARPPSYTPNPAPRGKYPVRIVPAGGDYGYVDVVGDHAGLVGDNPYTGWNEGDAYASCMVLDNGFQSLGSANNLDDLKVTAAHEFFHAITNGLGVRSEIDRSYREGGASWMEDEVYDAIDDNYQYLWPLWQQSMGAFPDDPSGAAYGYWLVWRGLTEQYGSGVPGGAEDVMQRILVGVSKGRKQMPATEKAFEAEHTYLSWVYHNMAVAARFMKPCGGGYVSPYCFEEAAGYTASASANFPVDGVVTKTQGYTGAIRDDYALNWVKLPDTPKQYPIVVKNTSSNSSFFWSVACDRGTELRVDVWAPLDPGMTANLGVNRKGCVSPSYVTITNQHVSAGNPTSSPTASYKVWVPYIPMTGHLTWSVSGSSSGADGNVSWSESWTESGDVTLAITRDPVNYADYLVVDNGSTYTVDYTYTRSEQNSLSGCTTDFDGAGSGAGLISAPSGFLGTTWFNWDPPDTADAYPDLLAMTLGATLDYTETWSNDCGGGGTTEDPNGAAPFYYGLAGVSQPVCVPPALTGAESYTDGWGFAGAWNDAQKRFEFGCSKTVPVPGGSQTITLGGTASYVALP